MNRWAGMVFGMLAAVLTCATASAETRPAYLPQRDVTVSYSVKGRAVRGFESLHVRYIAAQQRLRVESDDRAMGYLIIDPRTRRAQLVVPGLNQHVELPLARDRRAALLFNDRLNFKRRGTARIAGLGCTLWDVRGGGDAARACITQDGVILRLEGTKGGLSGTNLEAVRVAYAPQDARLFDLPRAVELPGWWRRYAQPH